MTFKDDEENRHEYKEIHEEYISILESTIEAQLNQFYSEEQVNNFYKDFIDNFDSYKELNEDAYTIMCASIDFVKFKDQMLKFKLTCKTADHVENVKQNFGATGADKF